MAIKNKDFVLIDISHNLMAFSELGNRPRILTPDECDHLIAKLEIAKKYAETIGSEKLNELNRWE